MFSPLVTAIRTLTTLPIPGHDCDDRSASLPLFPVVGALIGLILYFEAVGVSRLFSAHSWISSLLVTASAVLITGALHLDGFADVADGFGGGHSKERILEILKDSRHGTFGVCAIVFDIAGRIILTAWCIEHRHFELLAVSPVFSRTVQAWGCALLPYARPAGGTASPFFTAKPPLVLLVITLGVLVIYTVIAGILPFGTIFLVSLIPVQLFYGTCIKKIDGLTGDCLGAVNEVAELSFLLTACITYSLPGLR